MKAYKVELLIIDFDEMGEESIKETIENQKYPNYCISPSVMYIHGKDIGEWDDNHLLNKSSTSEKYYNNLFNTLSERVSNGLDREHKRQKKVGKKFMSDQEIDDLIDKIIKEEMGDNWKETYE